jgi:putative YhdH/YhfP family quinone oxidoreductase
MPSTSFRALVAEGVRKDYRTDFKQIAFDELPPGDVLIEIIYSSLNFKDGLAVTGRGDILKQLPMVCGIDLAGRVIESTSEEFRAGDEVLGVGQGLGETIWGGYSERARVPATAILRVPPGLSLKQTMAIGTAGFTAMLSVMALEDHGVEPGEREMLVTGAAGGVGSVAVALLAARGYKVVASTGRPELHDYLRKLGAMTVVDRATLADKARPLASERWAGGIDTVGGQTLASALAATAARGAIAACGLVGGVELPTTVLPFILRNIALLGINSVQTPQHVGIRAWDRLSRELPLDKLDAMTTVEPLSRIKDLSARILAGKIRGRVVIDVSV